MLVGSSRSATYMLGSRRRSLQMDYLEDEEFEMALRSAVLGIMVGQLLHDVRVIPREK